MEIMSQYEDFAVVLPLLDVGLRSNPNDRKLTFENGIWRTRSFPLAEGYYQVGELFMNQMKKNAELVGQIDPETGVEETYGNMLDRSIRCALWLKKQGVQPGDIVSVCTSHHLDCVIPLIGTFMIGATINIWWTNLPADVTENLIKLYKPKVVFLDKDKFELTSEVIRNSQINTLKLVCFQDINEYLSLNKILSDQDAYEVSNFKCTKIESPDQRGLILHTSGSTKLPKGVILGYKSLLKFSVLLPDSSLRDKMSPALDFSGFSWIPKIEFLLNSIAAGITIMIYKPPPIGPHAFEIISKYKVRWVFMVVPTAINLLEDFEVMKCDVSSVHYAITGGTFLPQDKFIKFSKMFSNAQVFCSYGMTEGVGKIAFSAFPRKPGCSGKFYTNVDFKIINEDGGAILEPKKPGELCLKSYRMFLGYFENSETAFDSEGWFHTGDIAHFDEDGEIYIIDRTRDLIRSVGYHMSAAAIEGVINEHSGVSQVAVVGKLGDGLEYAIAFIVKKTNVDIKKEDIINMVSERSPLLILNYTIFVTSLPKAHSGKVKKGVLREIVEKMSLEDIANEDAIMDLNF